MNASRPIKVSAAARLRHRLTVGLALGFICPAIGLAYYSVQAQVIHNALRARYSDLANPNADQERSRTGLGSGVTVTKAGREEDPTADSAEMGRLTPEQRRLRRVRRTIREIYAHRLASGGVGNTAQKSSGKPPPPSGPRGNAYFTELLSDPEYTELMKEQLQPRLEHDWRAFFLKYKLDERKCSALLAILLEDQFTSLDLRQLGGDRNTGKGMAEEMKVRAEWRKDRDAQLCELLGPGGDKRVNEYKLTHLYRGNFLDAFEAKLSYGPHPMEPLQEERLLGLLGQWAIDPNFNKRLAASSQTPSEDLIVAASAIFDATQLDALRELREESTPNEPPSTADAAARTEVLNRARAEAEGRAKAHAEMEAELRSKMPSR